jgi:hypothetical protein
MKAQVNENIFNLKDYSACADLSGNIDLASLSVSNHFMNTLLFKDHIDSQTKQWMFNALKNKNTLGFDLNENISYIVFPDTLAGTTNLGIFAGFGNYFHIDMNVTDDLLKLFFGGNTQFKGKTAILDNSSLNLISYQQLQLGIVTKFGDGKIKHTFGIAIGINKGIQNASVNIDRGKLFTEKNAEYIDLNAEYDFHRSDTSGNSTFKGIGSSLNLYYSFTTEKNDRFDFSATDLGFIRWNKNSQQFSKDTSIHFEGVSIDDPLNIEGNIFGDSNPDSLANTFTNADTTKAYFMLTPACFRISYTHVLSKTFRIEGSITKKLYVHYDPLFMIRVSHLCGSKNIFSASLSYGGYTGSNPLKSHNINTGIELAHRFGKGFIVKVGTNYLNGFINPHTQTAEGAYLSLKKYFF